MNTFDQLISTFSSSGKEFEVLCKWLLETDPVYASKLIDVWTTEASRPLSNSASVNGSLILRVVLIGETGLDSRQKKVK